MSQSETNETAATETDAEALAVMTEEERAIDTAHAFHEEPEQAEAGSGVTVKRAWTMKNFLPSSNPRDWIMANVCAKGTGTRVTVGRVFGMIYESEHKTKMWGDSPQTMKEIKSIALSGDLQAQKMDGSVITFDVLFLPMAFASRIDRALRQGARHVEMDVDIGIEAIAANIPYEWTVTSYLEGKAERVLRNMANSRRIGEAAPGAGSKALLHGPANGSFIETAVQHVAAVAVEENGKRRRA